MKMVKQIVMMAFVSLMAQCVWAATPVALFSGETLKAGTVNGITLDLNGNTAADGAITIGSKPVLVSGLSGSDVSVVVTYKGPITATEYALVSAKSSGYDDLSGIWTEGTQIHGLWANNPWTANNAVHKDGTIPSAADKVHRFCFTYGSGSGTYLYVDGKEVYPAGTLKGQNLNPIGLAIGGMRGNAKGAATGLVLSEIAIYNEKVDGSLCAPPANEVDDADCFGVFTASAEGLDKKISQTEVPSLGGAVIRVKNAEVLQPGAYTLVEWADFMAQGNYGYGSALLDLPGYTGDKIRLIPLVGKLVLQVLEDDQETKNPLKIWCVGDSITEGYNGSGNCANYRVQLASKLSLLGYNPQMVGQYTHRSRFPSGAEAFDKWAWHSGVSAQRVWTRTASGGANSRAGYMESIDAALYQVQEADIVLFKLSTNDIGNNDTAEHIIDGITNIVGRIARGLPNAKIIVATPIWYNTHDVTTTGNKIRAWVATNPHDGRVTLCDLNAALPAQKDAQDRVVFHTDNVHPNWNGHDVMSDAWLASITKLVDKDGFAPVEKTPKTLAYGAENNVDASYTEGFTKVKKLAIPVEAAYALNATPDYETVAETPAKITKVAYYLELVRTDTDDLRYVWVDMDAFGETLDAMLVPTGANVQQFVDKLHVASNMGSITPVDPMDNTVRGYLEFSPYTASNAETASGPAKLWNALDWNDTLGTEGDGRGCMQIHRVKTTGDALWNGAETLFCWNNWGAGNNGPDGTKAGEIGIGNFAQHYMTDTSAGNGIGSLINAKYGNGSIAINDGFVSSDYTNLRFSPWGDTMNAKAYSVRTLEIWVKEAEVVTDPVATIGEEPYATLASALRAVAGEETIEITLVKPCAETVTIPANAKVISTTESQFTGAVSGSGRLVCEGYAPATNGALATSLQNAAWTGTLELKNVSQTDFRYDLQLLANTGSTICFNGYTNYPCAPTNSGNVGRDIVAGAWEIGEGGVTFTGGFSNFGFNYVGALKGTGKIKCELTGSNGRNYVRFEGDASEFTGTVEFASNSSYRIALAATETADGDFTSQAVRTVYVASGVTTSLRDVVSGTVVGAGTLVADGAMPSAALQNNLKANTWTGTLWLKNLTTSAERSATLIGNSSSVVRYTNVRGWMTTAMKFDGTVDIVNDEDGNGLTIDNGSSGWADNRVVRFGHLTGAGTLNLAWNKTYPLHLKDVSGFTGSITCGNANGIGVLIGDEVTIDSTASGNGKIQILEGADATAGAVWTAPNGFVVDGSLATGKNQLKANANTLGVVSGSGTLKVSGANTADNPRLTAFVSSLANFTGTLHLAAGRIECQANEVPAAVTIKVTDGAQFYAGGATTEWNNHFVISGNGWTGETRYGNLSLSAMRMEHTLGADAVVETVVENGVVPRVCCYNGNKTFNATFTGPGVKFLCYNGSNTVTADPAKLTGLTGEIALTNVTLVLENADAMNPVSIAAPISGGTVKKTGAGMLQFAAGTTAPIKLVAGAVYVMNGELNVTTDEQDMEVVMTPSGSLKVYTLNSTIVTEVTFTIGAAPEHAMVAIMVGEDVLQVENGQYTAAVGSSFSVVYLPAPGYVGTPVTVSVTVTSNMATTTIATPEMTITRPSGIGEGECATKYDTWVGKQDQVSVLDATADQLKTAFALNCAPTDDAIDAKRKSFTVEISIDAEGVHVEVPSADYNIDPVVRGSTTVNGEYNLPDTDPAARFFKAFIEL